jgi:hypothetical protein
VEIALPPIDADFAGLIDGGDQKPNPDAQEFCRADGNGNVPGNNNAFVENVLCGLAMPL